MTADSRGRVTALRAADSRHVVDDAQVGLVRDAGDRAQHRRHLLLVLDCCFSGAFKWSSRYRNLSTLMPKRIYKERFDRFIEDPAWQVITSAAYDQKALDVLDRKATGDRGIANTGGSVEHSPFAQALFSGLAGAADIKGEREGDGLITATEL